MIKINNHKQIELFDPWGHLSPKRRKMLDDSWAGLFKNEILSELPVLKLAPYFHKSFGRPTKELYTVLGMLILQQTHDLTDEETSDQLSYNIQWHYALNITEESDSAKYISPKTLWNMRQAVIEMQLVDLLFQVSANKLAKLFQVSTDKQRIDSVHIKSNMRRLGRITIFATTIRKYLTNLKRNHKDLYSDLNDALINKYMPQKAFQCFSLVKPSDSNKTLNSVSSDLFDLYETFKNNPKVKQMKSFMLLKRVLDEQCNVVGHDTGKAIEVKKPKEIPSSSLQNPSDPDATYSGHKGQGYQVQVMETYTDTDDEVEKAKTLNLITHIDIEEACQSDAQALKPAIKSAKAQGLCPKELSADSLYGSDENSEYAKSEGVELISPTMGASKVKGLSLADFEFLANGHIKECPNNIKPSVSKKKKIRFTQGFSPEVCTRCQLKDQCPAKPGKKQFYVRYSEKEMRIAKRRARENTSEFKNRYRWRAGVEATMSEYSTRTGVKKLRVRGYKMVKFCATLKAIGVNIHRATAVKKARKGLIDPDYNPHSQLFYLFVIFKEQIKNELLKTIHKCFNYFKTYCFVTL